MTNFEYRSSFADEDMGKSLRLTFLGHPVCLKYVCNAVDLC